MYFFYHPNNIYMDNKNKRKLCMLPMGERDKEMIVLYATGIMVGDNYLCY